MDYELLYKVSIVDAQILKIKRNIQNKQTLKELSGLKKQYLALKEEYEDIRIKETELSNKINDSTLILGKKKEEKDMYTQNLYSTSNTKTIETCQISIDRLSNDMEILNEDEYTLMVDNEELTKLRTENYDKLKEVREGYNKKLKKYKEKCVKEEKAILKLTKERTHLISKVDSEVAKEYEMLVSESGCGMSEIDGEICSGCNLDVPTVIINVARHGKRLTKCPNCGRFIYASNVPSND